MKQTDLMRVAIRLSLLQSTWFEGGMQSIGLAYCLIPGLKSIYPRHDDLHRAIERYKEPFNTHPFLVGVIVGALLKMEKQHASPKEIAYFCTNNMGILAAFGDPFFRSALPVFVAILASLAAMLGGVLAGVATLLILFNSIHFAVRIGGFTVGYREGRDVIPHVARWLSPLRTRMMRLVSAFGGGTVLAVAAMTFGTRTSDLKWSTLAAALGGVVASVALTTWRPSQFYTIPIVLTVVVLVEVAI